MSKEKKSFDSLVDVTYSDRDRVYYKTKDGLGKDVVFDMKLCFTDDKIFHKDLFVLDDFQYYYECEPYDIAVLTFVNDKYYVKIIMEDADCFIFHGCNMKDEILYREVNLTIDPELGNAIRFHEDLNGVDLMDRRFVGHNYWILIAGDELLIRF